MEKKNNRCLITGASGMDASNLIKYLLELGYDVTGTNRRTSSPSDWRHEELGIVDKFKSVSMDLTDSSNVFDVIREGQYDRVFSLGGMSFVSESFNSPLSTVSINTIGHLNILEAVRKYSQHSRIYFAATSEMFGKVQEVPQTETTPFYPRSPYGVSKLASYWLTKNYRESYGLYACSGILFNHEGPLRSTEFVTRKITSNIARIFMEYSLEKTITPFELGNIDAKRDWGNSEDFVKAMVLMLQQKVPDDFVIATGETHTVREFIEECFKYLGLPIIFKGKGLNEKIYIKGTKNPVLTINKEYFRPAEVDLLIGNPAKAKEILGWEPTTKFSELVTKMMKADLKRNGVNL